MRLENKVALVTGSAKGIGKAIALALAKEGCNLVINDITFEPMQRVVEEIKIIGRRTISIAADVRDQEQVNKMVN